MGRLSRAVGRAAAHFVPAEQREWTAALWAEAQEVPPGVQRLIWRAGGIRLMAREAVAIPRVRSSLMVGAAAAGLVWSAMPGTGSSLGTAFLWLRTVTTIGVLAVLPWFVRRRLGAVVNSRLARWLRVAGFVAIVGLTIALGATDRVVNSPRALAAAGPFNQPSIGLLLPWLVFLILMAGYAGVVLAVTAQRSWVTPRTLAIGAGTGIALGVVMYVIMPLGLGKYATAPWFTGSAMDPVVVAAWVLLLAGPVAAALMAGLRCRDTIGPLPQAEARIRQGVVAGLLVTTIGSLVVCALGTATLASFGMLAHVLYPNQHLTAASIATRAITLTGNAPGYFLVWMFFPIIGVGLGAITALAAWANQAMRKGDGPGGGSGGSRPIPMPPAPHQTAQSGNGPVSVPAGWYARTRAS